MFPHSKKSEEWYLVTGYQYFLYFCILLYRTTAAVRFTLWKIRKTKNSGITACTAVLLYDGLNPLLSDVQSYLVVLPRVIHT